MNKRKYLSISIIALIIVIPIILVIIEFFVSSHKNGTFNDKFEKIRIGAKPQEVINALGTPIRDVPAMNSLAYFFGSKNISEEQVKPIKKIYTYKATGMFYMYTWMCRPTWQIGFDDNDNAICKHYY
jgi:hypothetical protein